jgi:hypothetical protein
MKTSFALPREAPSNDAVEKPVAIVIAIVIAGYYLLKGEATHECLHDAGLNQFTLTRRLVESSDKKRVIQAWHPDRNYGSLVHRLAVTSGLAILRVIVGQA